MLTELDWRTCRHEAAHAVSAHLLDWVVNSVERRKDSSGLTDVAPRTDPPMEERRTERAVILLAGILTEASRSSEDQVKVADLFRQGVTPASAYARAVRLIEAPRFRHLHAIVTDALWRKPRLSQSDLATIFEPLDAVPPSGTAAR